MLRFKRQKNQSRFAILAESGEKSAIPQASQKPSGYCQRAKYQGASTTTSFT